MKIKDYWEVHNELTGKASDVVRGLIIAGVGIAWVFHQTKDNVVLLPKCVTWALVFLVAAGALDLAQYIWSGTVYGVIARKWEKAHKRQEDDVPFHSAWLNVPTYGCYWAKCALVAWGYALMGHYLWGQTRIN